MTKPIAAFLTLAALLTASEAKAQHLFRRGYARQAVTYASPTPTVSSAPAVSGPAADTRVYPYSYYASRGLPARTYQGYGAQDFPFHGTPYGHLYDPWTWPYLSGSYGRGLAHYYDPPVK